MKSLIVRNVLTLIGLLFSLIVSAETYVTYYHSDLLGSPAATTSESGQLVWREYYKPYGEKIKADDVGNSFGYTGHVFDSASQLVYMQARYYDPVIGRFLALDPVGFVESNPVSFNRYAYGNNNPLRFVDPDGEAPRRTDGAGGAAAGAVLLGWITGRSAADAQLIAQTAAIDGEYALGGSLALMNGGNAETYVAGIADRRAGNSVTKKAPEITTPYKRPSGATTKAQRESVQNQPCVDCGNIANRQVADHKKPLVQEYYETGTIDKTKMRSVDAVQPQCPTCSARQGAEMSRYSRQKKEELGL